jgi:HEAT repeat protein
VIPLVAKFDDTSLEVKKAAIRAVGKLGDRAAVPALVRKTTDPDEPTKMAAVGALGQLGATDAIDALVEQLGSGSQAYRAKVAYSLGQIAASPGAGKAGEDAMKTLVENLAQHDTRDAARDALRVAGKAAVPALVAHLTGRLKGDPSTAVTLLSEQSDARATAALTAELERGRVAMPLVLKALGATGDPVALVPVLGALSNKDAAIRIAAMNALRPLVGRDARAADVLIEHLADDDLEVRVLAAEYLGVLHSAAAAPKLIALAGPGNPTRLRLASIDALGEIGTVTSAPATKVLLDVLREGPGELHKAAATSLSYIADASAIPALIAQAKADRGPTRHEIVRALGATLRGHGDANARKLLRELAEDSNVKVALAAIGGLAAAGDTSDAPLLRAIVEQGAADRRRAAAAALGDLHDAGAFGVLAAALSVKDDRLVGDAAWALGELASAAPKDSHVPPLVERWLYLAHHGGWAASIDSTAALARALWAHPPQNRADLVGGERRSALLGLAFHKSRALRVNAVLAMSSLPGDDVIKTLVQLLHDDPSPHVRIAAATGLGRSPARGDVRVTGALTAAFETDTDLAVKQAAKAALAAAPPMPARTEWRTFYVVEPNTDDAPVRQVPYFVYSDDGLVWATYTDARGELDSEHVPPGTNDTPSGTNVRPGSHENEF